MDSLTLSRRKFLAAAGIVSAGVGLAACSPAAATPVAMTMEPMTPSGQGGPTVDEMDTMHKTGVETYVGNIGKDTTFWRKPLEPKMQDGFKVFEITCTEGMWEVAPGQSMQAMMYNGMVPGPEIRITEGDKVRVIVTNNMTTQSTGVHFHGVIVPNAMDGVPFITQDPIKPGGTFTYEFTARNTGSHMYHSHHNAAEQVTKGLMGAFIIEPKDKSSEPKADIEYTMILNDSGIGLTINGKSFPYTQPLTAALGQTIRVRYMNEGLMIHPMHLHGLPQLVTFKDGWKLPQPYKCDTLNIAPGERYDVFVECTEPGIWAYHCHILSHAESAHGMYGMVTALIIK